MKKSKILATEAPKTRASHDMGYPQHFIDFMMSGWEKPKAARVQPIKNAAILKNRRAQLADLFPNDVLVIPTGSEVVRANDTHFRFRPASHFFYLTGCHEPDCVLVIAPKSKKHESPSNQYYFTGC